MIGFAEDHRYVTIVLYSLCVCGKTFRMLPKSQMGKIKLPDSLRALVETQQKANDLKIVFVEPKHIFALSELPEIHKDPFDRLLIAQANVENVFLVSADSVFEKYPVKFLW